MLIILGGLKGSGRRALAKELARQRGYHWYDTKQHRVRGRFFTKDGAVKEYLTDVYGDEAHVFLLQKVVKDLPLLSKTHADVVLDYPFGRRASREFFFAEAKRYFSAVIFVWIHANEETARARLLKTGDESADRESQIAMRRRERALLEHEPVEHEASSFLNEGPLAESAARLSLFIEEDHVALEKSLSGS